MPCERSMVKLGSSSMCRRFGARDMTVFAPF
jgi:hypothetical protein